MKDVSALVAQFYEGRPYPEPVADLAQSIAEGGYQVGDPALWSAMLWPDGRPREHLRILVAGCGTAQAAWFAYTNRESEVIGVDLSAASLAHERYLQERHGLDNLRLYQGDLREVGDISADFDLVVCTGVLHHMDDPNAGTRALAGVMAPGAALAAMVYGATRRSGVYMMQDAFRRLGVGVDDAGVAFARRTLASLPPWHFVQHYIDAASELEHDAALVDTFLHPQDRAYTVPQVLALVEDNGLTFQGWFENSVYYPEGVPWLSPELAARVTALPACEQWAVMEMLSPALGTHYFFARKGEAPAFSFAAPDWLAYVPRRRPGFSQTGPHTLRRAGRTLTLEPVDAALFARADGALSLAEIAGEMREETRALFERLWKQGHVLLTRAPHASSSTSQ